MSKRGKEWYKTKWGIVIVVLILPYFFVWWVWAKSNWNKTLKWIATIAVVIVVIFMFVGMNTETTTNHEKQEKTGVQKEQVQKEISEEQDLIIQEENSSLDKPEENSTTDNEQQTYEDNTKTEPPVAPIVSKNWYEGGTLHKATILEWKLATEENKLATAADFMASVDSSVSMSELKNRAIDLKNCIDIATSETTMIDDQPVLELVATCLILGGYSAS